MGRLTELELKALTITDVGRRLIDEGGLTGKVRARAGKVIVSFEYRYRVASGVRSVVCGTWPDSSLTTIRRTRDTKRLEVSKGGDPVEANRLAKLRAEVARAKEAEELEAERTRLAAETAARRSVRQAIDQWFELELIRRKEAGQKESKRALEKDILPTLGAVSLVDVRRVMVLDLLDRVKRRGALILANRLFADLRQFFNYCVLKEWIPVSPLMGVRRDNVGGDETPRDRALAEAEIRELHAKLSEAGLARQTELALWIMLSTCCRVGELSQARWDHVDFDTSEWTIPAANAKNARVLTIYLSPFAARQFQELRTITGNTDWCYPSRDGGHIYLKSITRQIRDRQRLNAFTGRSKSTGALLLRGGEWTVHDLRRTGATLMGELGVSAEVIERVLNHTPSKLMQTYQTSEQKESKREAWRRLGDRLELLTSNIPNVVTLKQKSSAGGT